MPDFTFPSQLDSVMVTTSEASTGRCDNSTDANATDPSSFMLEYELCPAFVHRFAPLLDSLRRQQQRARAQAPQAAQQQAAKFRSIAIAHQTERPH